MVKYGTADYEQLYSQTENVYGEPLAELSTFFKRCKGLNVCDMGCGQGRDALMIAMLGHRVTAIDRVHHGITQMLTAAKTRRLMVEGIVCDAHKFRTRRRFDVVLLDRVLHTFRQILLQKSLLVRSVQLLRKHGVILIVDEPRHAVMIEHVLRAEGMQFSDGKKRGKLWSFER